MPIRFSCPRCDRRYTVSEAIAGKRIKCKGCGQEQTVPQAGAARETSADPWVDIDEPVPSPRSRAVAAVPPRVSYEDDDAHDHPAPPPRPGAPRTSKKRSRGGRDLTVPQLLMISAVGLGLAGVLSLLTRGPGLLGLGMLVVGIAWLGWGSLAALATSPRDYDYSLTVGVMWWFRPLRWLIRILYVALHCAQNPPALGAIVVGGFFTFGGAMLAQDLGRFIPDSGRRPNEEGFAQTAPVKLTQVDVHVAGLKDDAEVRLVERKLSGAGGGAVGSFVASVSRSSDGMTHYAVKSSGDPKAVADAIHFGTITSRSANSIDVTADLPSEEVAAADIPSDRGLALPAMPPPGNPFEKKPQAPAPDPVDRLLADLKSPDRNVQSRALAELERLTPNDRVGDVAGALVPMLRGADSGFLDRVFKALAVWHAPEVVPTLIEKLKDRGLTEHNRLIRLLGQIKDPRAIPALVAELKGDSSEVRDALIKDFGAKAEPALVVALRHPDSDIRRIACEILGEIGGELTLQAMRVQPPDRDDSVREAAKQAWSKIVARVGPLPGANRKTR